jgi:mono/diheme cytochrome c family protein
MRQVIPAHHGPAQLLPLTTIAADGTPGASTLAPVRGGVLVSWLRDADIPPTVAFRRVGLDAMCGPEAAAPAATPSVVSNVAPTVHEGRELYAENGCATCHGAEGHGDGPVGKTLTPMPRDFRDGAAFKAGRDEGAIARTVAEGYNQGGSKMPAFAHLSEQERRSLALFVISLRDRH